MSGFRYLDAGGVHIWQIWGWKENTVESRYYELWYTCNDKYGYIDTVSILLYGIMFAVLILSL